MPKEKIDAIPLDAIRLDGGTQARIKLREDGVAHYRTLIEEHAEPGPFPWLSPAVVYFDGSAYWLANGFHRYHAYQQAGHTELPCVVRQGARQDAVKCAAGANADNGLERTKDDARQAVLLLLKEFPELTTNQIAELARVSWHFADKTRTAAQPTRPATATDSKGREQPTRKITRTAVAGEDVDELPARQVSEADAPEDTAAAAAAPAAADVRSGERLQDKLGLDVPAESAEAFKALEKFKEAKRLFDALGKLLNELAQVPGGEALQKSLQCTGAADGPDKFYSVALKNARRDVLDAMPYTAHCPYCLTRGDSDEGEYCTCCRGRGYVTEMQLKQAPEEKKRAVLSRAAKREEAA